MTTVQKNIFILLGFLFICFSGYSQRIKYQGEIGMTYNMGLGSLSTHLLGFETVQGISITPYLATGIGFGLSTYLNSEELYYDELEEEYYNPNMYLPLFLNIKGYLFDNNISPFLSINTGYNMGIENFAGKGNFYLSPSIGVHFGRHSDFGGLVSIGYEVPKVIKEVIRGSSQTIVFKLSFAF